MKTILPKLIFPVFACLFFASCSSDEFAGVEESKSFDALSTYYDQIDDWNATALNAVDADAFAQVSFTAATSNTDCEGSTSTTASSSIIASNVTGAISLYAETIGFESPRALNRWFIDFGKHFYDLVIEHRPENKVEFINHVSDLHLAGANACVKGSMQRMSVSAYNFAKVYGIRTNTVDARTQEHDVVYGVSSPTYATFIMLADKTSCQGTE